MPNFSVDLSGQTAIITGAAQGVGAAVARRLASAGAQLVLNDVNPDGLETLADDLRAAGHAVQAFHGDISNRFQASALIERGRDAFGRVQILVCAAGVFRADPLLKMDDWDWQRQLDVNLSGTFYITQLLGRVMAEEGGGNIIHVGNRVGLPGQTLERGLAYTATRAGLLGLTRQAARELAAQGIRVNNVLLGNIPEPDMPASPPANMLGVHGTLDDAANAVLFLLSDGARFITGQQLVVDGGGL